MSVINVENIINLMYDKFNYYSLSGINFNDFETAGIQCANYMTIEFKITITIISIILYYLIIRKIFPSLKLEGKLIESSIIEKTAGIVSIITLIIQTYLKAVYSRSMIFMLNPCHFSLLLQSLFLIKKNTKTMKLCFYISTLNIFTGVLGLINPLTNGLTKVEKVFFVWEHILLAIINPFVLMIYKNRYYHHAELTLKNHILAHCFFSLYQRLILFPISQLLFVNINFTLCPALSKFLIFS